MSREFKQLIGGKLVEGAGAMDVINPATEECVARCPVADIAQIDAAVAAAKAAFPAWSARSQDDRAALVVQLADALQERAQEFAALLTAEQGKPTDQAFMEIMGSAHTLRTIATMRTAPRVLRDTPENRVVEVRTPLGVVAAITPWNFPVILLMTKVAPALLTGNTLVAKPAATTPLTSLLFGELCQAILPPGVVNVICDRNDLGGYLTGHPDVAKVAFTGSTATGKKVMQSVAGTVKRLTLELGGNDAAIVLDDVDVHAAARNVFQGAMANAGQICVAIKRAYVPSGMYDAFCDELAVLAKHAIVDDGSKQGAQIGPLQNRVQYEKVRELIADARKTGTVIAGGDTPDRKGYFIAPTIVRDVDDDARIVREEQFGPVLPVLRYDDIDDVIARANDSEFGLAGTIWATDIDRAVAVASRIDTGTVWINQHLAIDPLIPFRGAKQSGFGGELGEQGLEEYTQAKIINIALRELAPAH